MMHVGGQTGAFPPIGGLYLEYKVTHTHTHALYLHMETEIGLLIVLRQTDLKGQQRCLCRETCLVIVTANRKTIGDLNSRMIKSTFTSVPATQEKDSTTDSHRYFSTFFIPLALVCWLLNSGKTDFVL